MEADVVEAGKAGAHNVFDGVVGDKEVLLPPHEDVVRLVQCVVVKVVGVEGLGVLVEGDEFALQEKQLQW